MLTSRILEGVGWLSWNQRRPNDDQTQYQDQYWNGPEANHWLVHEHRYERMGAPFTRLVLDAAAVARTDRVLDISCGTGSTTCTAARAADDGLALGVDIARPCCSGPNSEPDTTA